MSITLTPIKKAAIFKTLAYKTLYDTGVEFGLDKHYKDIRAVKNAVHRIFNEVKADPDKFAVQPETMEVVLAAMSNRVAVKVEVPLAEKNEAINDQDVKSLVTGGRNKALRLLHSKMDRIGKSKKKLDATSVGELAKVAGILFDKSQIIQGEATEHVAIMAKIDKNMDPDEALNLMLRMREVNQEEFQKKPGPQK